MMFIELKKAQLPTDKIPAYTRQKIEAIWRTFHIEHINNPVISMKKDAEQEDEGTILSKMKLINLVRIEVSDQ
jgi:hypothetical protein